MKIIECLKDVYSVGIVDPELVMDEVFRAVDEGKMDFSELIGLLEKKKLQCEARVFIKEEK